VSMNAEAERSYITSSLLPAMGLSGRSFAVETPADAGTRSTIRLIRIEGFPPLLMRTYSHRRQGSATMEALRHLESLALPAPRLVYHDLQLRSRLAGGDPFVTVETWIEGRRLSSLDDETSRDASIKVAALLARFHGVTRAGWGPPRAARFVSFAAATLRGTRRMLHELNTAGWFDPQEALDLETRFSSWREPIAALGPFSLVHSDANRHNFVLTPAGEVCPVDLQRVNYEPFPEEVINALYHLCRKDGDLADRFIHTYFSHVPGAARETFEATRAFFEPLHYLKKMCRRSRLRAPAPEDAKMIRWGAIVRRLEPPAPRAAVMMSSGR